MKPDNFVGRVEELQELERAMATAAGGQLSLQLIRGEPGIGKTTLAKAFEQTANNNGFVSAWGRCWEAGAAPAFWPWNNVLKACAKIIGEQRLSELLTAQCTLNEIPDSLRGGLKAEGAELANGQSQVTTVQDGSRLKIFDAVSQVLSEACNTTHLLIIIDDLHAADVSSLNLLLYVIRQLQDARLIIIGAYRKKEAEISKEISEPLAKISREGNTLSLSGLGREHSSELYQYFTGSPITAELAEELAAVSNGNPLFFTEFARLRSHKSSAKQQTLPLVLNDILEQRISLLPAASIDALTTAALIGREFSARLLAIATSSTPEGLNELFTPALELNIIETMDAEITGTLLDDHRFNHEFIRDFFEKRIPSENKKELHRNIACAMENHLSGTPYSLSTVARHYYASLPLSPSNKVMKQLLNAARSALRSGAYEEVVELASLTQNAVLASDGTHHKTSARAHLVSGRASLALGEFRQAKTSFNLSFDAASAAKSGADTIRAALGCGAMTDIGNTGPKLISQLRRGLELAKPSDIALRALAIARLAQALLYTHEREEAETQALKARSMCDSSLEPVVQGQILHFTAQALYRPDNLEQRITDAKRIVTLAQQAGNARIEVLGLEELIQHSLEAGNYVQAADARTMLTTIAAELQNNLPTWLAMTHEALRLAIAGKFDDAEAQAVAALEHGSGNSNLMAWMLYFSMLHQLHWHRNTVQDAIPTLEETRRQLPQSSSAQIGLLYAQADLDPKDPAIVTELDRYVGNDFADIAPDTYWLISMGMLSEIAVVAGHLPATNSLYTQLLPHADQHAFIYHGCYRGPISRILGLLAQCNGDYTAADTHFQHAIAAEKKMHSPAFECYARINRVNALLESQRTGMAAEISQECAAIEKILAAFSFPRAAADYEKLQPLLQSSQPTKSNEDTVKNEVQLRREAQYWSLATEGRLHRLKHSIGLDYLARLLTSAGSPVAAVDLVNTHAPSTCATTDSARQSESSVNLDMDVGSELIDEQARRQYKQHLENLRESISEAEKNNDLGAIAQYQTEIDMVTEQLMAATGLGGRHRKFTSQPERARSATTKAIRTTIKKIAQLEPAIGSYLQDNVKTGRFCEYQPGAMQQVNWNILYSDAGKSSAEK